MLSTLCIWEAHLGGWISYLRMNFPDRPPVVLTLAPCSVYNYFWTACHSLKKNLNTDKQRIPDGATHSIPIRSRDPMASRSSLSTTFPLAFTGSTSGHLSSSTAQNMCSGILWAVSLRQSQSLTSRELMLPLPLPSAWLRASLSVRRCGMNVTTASPHRPFGTPTTAAVGISG